MKILLTNDDSHRSPLLTFIIEKLRASSELSVVVPKHEQSWKGKSMTRYGYLHREELTIHNFDCLTVDGTPADCANIGIYHSPNGRPDLVVSGINAGLNAGTGFIFSSGTIGACLEANIAGLPAVAISQAFDTETRNLYANEYSLTDSTKARLHKQCKPILDRIFSMFEESELLRSRPLTWNINIPFEAADDLKFHLAPVGHSIYGQCYRLEDSTIGKGRFEHDLVDIVIDKRDNCDSKLLAHGHVTVTPLDIFSFGQLDPALKNTYSELFD